MRDVNRVSDDRERLRRVLTDALNGLMPGADDAWAIIGEWDALTQLRAERDTLREALETWPQDDSVHEPGCRWIDVSDDCDCFTSIARAALAPVPEPAAEETSDG